MIWNTRKSPRPARRPRPFAPQSEVLEGRPLLSSYLQASDLPGGGVYGVDVLGGLAHNQDTSLLSTHLDGLTITTISSGTTKAGGDDVFVQALGSNEIYYATPGLLGIVGGGFVDQHVALKQFENLPNGDAYGIDNQGALYHYQEGTTNGIGGGAWTKVGGGGIVNFSARTLANGTDEVFVKTVDSKIIEWRASTGFVDLHAGMASVYAAQSGDYSVGYDGSIYHYSNTGGWTHVGGSDIDSVSVGSTASGQEDIYARAFNGNLYTGNASGVTAVFGKLQTFVATGNGGAYGIGYDGALYHYVGSTGVLVGGSGIDSIAPGINSSGQDEVYVHYSVVNILGVKVGMVGKYEPSVSSGITPILDLLT